MEHRPRPQPAPAPGQRPMSPEEIRRREERDKRKQAAPKPEKQPPRHEDPVDESSDESFPASDPPSHGGGRDRR